MAYEVEFTAEFELWWNGLEISDQADIGYSVGLLAEKGPALARPHADTLKGSRYSHLKELRVQSGGRPLRILSAFDPRRVALLLLGGNKAGDDRWYDINIRKAEQIYAAHLAELEKRD